VYKGRASVKPNNSMQTRQVISTIVFLIFGPFVFGQTDTTKVNSTSYLNDHLIEVVPRFNGGEPAILKIFSDSMVYPKLAFKERIGGKVIAKFTVDTLGNVEDISIVLGVREDINNEAIRLVGLLKEWTPGTQNGKKVKVIFKLPMYFYPDDKFKRKYQREHHMNK